MSVGGMKHRVELQYRTSTSDGAGGGESTWTTKATVWCKITPRSQSERLKGMQIEGPATHEVKMRYRSDIDNTWRLKYGTRYFNVTQVLDTMEKGAYLDVIVQEGVAT